MVPEQAVLPAPQGDDMAAGLKHHEWDVDEANENQSDDDKTVKRIDVPWHFRFFS
jgi:hypothetical protein